MGLKPFDFTKEEDFIEVRTPNGIGEDIEMLTPMQFAKNIFGTYRKEGKDGLDRWLDDHAISFSEVIDFIGPENIAAFPDKAEWTSGEVFSPLQTLMELEKQYRGPVVGATDVENAVNGSHVHDARLEQLAQNAERMSTKELEEALINAGMSVPRSSIMR